MPTIPAMPYDWGMPVLPRRPSADDLKGLLVPGMPSDGFLVTDDDRASLGEYNCVGSCLELKQKLGQDASHYLGTALTTEPASDELIVQYGGQAGLHVARRLRDPRKPPRRSEWYESKCGEGLRIVHRRRALIK